MQKIPFPYEWYTNHGCSGHHIAHNLIMANLSREAPVIDILNVVQYNVDGMVNQVQEAKLTGDDDYDTEHMTLAKYRDGSVMAAFWSDILEAQGEHPVYALETFPNEKALLDAYKIPNKIEWAMGNKPCHGGTGTLDDPITLDIGTEDLRTLLAQLEAVFGEGNVKVLGFDTKPDETLN